LSLIKASEQLPHRLSVVWFSDLVGWSQLTAEDEDKAIALVRRFQAAVRAVVSPERGRIVKFIGDAALVESPSAEAAVQSAAELRGLMGAGETIRTGIHLGDVAVAPDGDLYGDGVNTAQRIQTVADVGQIVVSGDVWRQLRNRPSFRFEPLGERSLKGVDTQDLYVVLEAGKMPAALASGGSPTSGAADVRSASERSIAVLPFMNLSSDPENEYFSDGITEEILNCLAALYGALGEPDDAFRHLERAYAERSAGLIYLHLDPMYDSLREDPRFQAMVERIGLK
jgi:adenylate cyclase